jgi:protease II
MKKVLLLSFVAAAFFSCQQNEKIDNSSKKEIVKSEASVNLIEKKEIKLDSDVMTAEVLWSFGRLGDVQLSPDKSTIIYGVSYYSKKENKGNRDLFAMN